MNGYVMVGTNDLTSAKKFYDKLLNVLNIKAIYSDDVCIGYANDGSDDVEFYVTKPANGELATYGNGTQVSFLTKTREKVVEFHKTGLDLVIIECWMTSPSSKPIRSITLATLSEPKRRIRLSSRET